MQALARFRALATRRFSTGVLRVAQLSTSTSSHRTFLFPDSDDPLMLSISHAKSVNEIFSLLERHQPQVDVRHCSQALASLFYLSKLHVMPLLQTSEKHMESLAARQADVERLGSSLYDEMDSLPVVAKSYAFLCLRRLGWQLNSPLLQKMQVQLADDLSEAKSLVADSYFASALKPTSHVRFSLFSTRLTRNLCLTSLMPRLRIYLAEAKSADDLARIGICLSQASLLVTPRLMSLFNQRVTEYLDQRGSFITASTVDPSANCYIAKALQLSDDLDQSHFLALRLYKQLSGNIKKLTCEKLRGVNRVVKNLGDQQFEEEVRKTTLHWIRRMTDGHQKAMITRCLLLTSYLRTWRTSPESDDGLTQDEAQRLILDVTERALSLEKVDTVICSTYVLEMWKAAPHRIQTKPLSTFMKKLAEAVGSCPTEEKANFFFDLIASYSDIVKKYGECPPLESTILSEMENLNYAQSAVPSHLFLYLGLKLLSDKVIDQYTLHRFNRLMPRTMDYSHCYLLVLCMEAHSSSIYRRGVRFQPGIRNVFKRLLEWSAYDCRQGEQEAVKLNLMLTLLNWQRPTCLPWCSEARSAMRRLSSSSTSLEAHIVTAMCSNLMTLPASFIEPLLLDTFIAFCVWNRVRVSSRLLLSLLHLCFRSDHNLQKETNFLRICSSSILQKFESISSTELLNAAIALLHYNQLSNELCDRIFSSAFMERLDATCGRRPSLLGELRFLLATLNRSVCLRQPQSNVPWRHDSFFSDRSATIHLQRSLERSFREEVNHHLAQVVGSSQLVKANCMSPMQHSIDFEIRLDDQGLPLSGSPASLDCNVSQKVAFLLVMDADNLGTVMPQIYDPGWVSAKVRDLEAEDYKVVIVKLSEWLTSYGNVVSDPEKHNRLRDSLKQACFG